MEQPTRLAPEMLVTRLGDYLVEKSIISIADLERALQVQESQRLANQPKMLGQILVDMGSLSREDLDQAVTEQIIRLRNALQQANQYLEQRVKERTQELELALSKLSELNQLKSNFVANISHELRTPMTHLMGYIELLSSSNLGPLTGDQRQALETMKRASTRLERLIEDMLRFSTLERGTLFLKIKPFHCSSTCLNLINQYRSRANERKIQLHLDTVPELPQIAADEEKLTWVISQLLDNAIKFTPEGGNVTVSVKPDGKFIQFSIQDTGIGISQERLNEIFEPFHQLDGSSTRQYGGTGLGLALARKIIEAHGTVIHVHSQPGKGSRFEFLLNTIELVPSSPKP